MVPLSLSCPSPSQTTTDTALPVTPLGVLCHPLGAPDTNIDNRPGYKSINVEAVANTIVGAPEQIFAFYHAIKAAKVVT